MEKELTTLLGQMETAKVNTVEEFKASQTFIDSYAIYYDSEFEDYLKQVKSIYPTLDLSKITMDEPLPSTLTGDTTLRESDDSTELEPTPKDDGVVLAQPTVNPSIPPVIPSVKLIDVENPLTQDKDSKAHQDAPASQHFFF